MPVMLEASAKLKYSEPTTNTKLEPVQVWLQTKVVPVVPELLEAASNAMAISASHHHANDDVGIQNDWQVLVDHHPVRYAGNTCDFIQHIDGVRRRQHRLVFARGSGHAERAAAVARRQRR